VSEPGSPDPPGVDQLVAALKVTAQGPGRFSAPSPDWWGGERVFGGMVMAQAMAAAAATVPPEFAPNSLHAYFLGPTPTGVDPRFEVESLRDGRAFVGRRVTTVAGDRPTLALTCSFHRPEEGEEYQLAAPDLPGPEGLPEAGPPVPFDLRELGPTPQRRDGTYEATRRCWMRARQPLPDDPALHAAALAYISDMTGAAFRPHSLGTWGTHTDASLDHSLWFHRPARVDQWLLYVLEALVNAGGRSTVRGLIYDREGRLVASMAQELLIRPLPDPQPQHRPAWTEAWGAAQHAAREEWSPLGPPHPEQERSGGVGRLVADFAARLEARDWDGLGRLLDEDVRYELPQTGERIVGRDRYLRFNAEYPGDWHLEPRVVLGDDRHGALLFSWSLGGETSQAVAFFEADGGRLTRITDFWPEPYQPPPGREHLVERD
jgi:acyl-CoA thioesterase-2